MEDPGKGDLVSRSTPQAEPAPQSIRLPSLIPVKRVTSANPLDQIGLADSREKKLLRRRLNSEDEKSLISFSKMEVIFGGRERAERRQGLNGEFQNPKNRWKDHKSHMIYDKRVSTHRKTSGRKKSEDLGLRMRIRSITEMAETRNRSENNGRQQSTSQIICSVQNQTDRQMGSCYAMRGREAQVKGMSKPPKEDSEQVCDAEQSNTKGSSFNTDKGTKDRKWMNQILDHSEHHSDARKSIRSSDKQTKLSNILQEARVRAKGARPRDVSKLEMREADHPRALPRRKSSYVSLRKDSVIAEKSDFDNISEHVGLESHMGSMHRRIPLHQNFGSQISEESDIRLDIEIENLNIWRGKGEDAESPELHWQIRFLELLDKDRVSQRSRKHSEMLLRDQNRGRLLPRAEHSGRARTMLTDRGQPVFAGAEDPQNGQEGAQAEKNGQ